ncbi:hypothetical protein WJX81_003326 [Elliptochloris bilobata]|uniref:Guanylate cyclase domain-containing protein n=1 Tax=Elliptochloris bilobata TaxID=381761 RepID=A0AAW1RN69_9CHLO
MRQDGHPTTSSIFDSLTRDEQAPWKARLSYHLEGLPATIFVSVVTFVALFLEDLRLAAFPPAADVACQVVFLTETVLASMVRRGYFLRMYFWIDTVATLSMALDISSLMDAMTHDISQAAGPSVLARGGTNNVILILKKITRVTRILRLMRLVKLFQQYLKLSDLTSQRVVVGILTMLFFIPGFASNYMLWGAYPSLAGGGLQMLHDLFIAQGATPAFNVAQRTYTLGNVYAVLHDNTENLLLLIVANDTVYSGGAALGSSRRTNELDIRTTSTAACSAGGPWSACFVSVAVFDQKWYVQFTAILNILRMVFICLVLAFGVYLLNQDAVRLVLRPIERMLKKLVLRRIKRTLKKVKDVSENPLANHRGGKFAREQLGAGEETSAMETRILEASITKICSLLAVGFGDAGAEVIAENIKNGGDLNPMIPGQKVAAIFGFCDVRQFTDATEVLQEDVMEFVNSIARIVHMEVSLHGGAPNKNVGDAFLLVWKFPKGLSLRDLRAHMEQMPPAHPQLPGSVAEAAGPHPGGVQPAKRPSILKKSAHSWAHMQQASDLADKALAAFVIINAALKRSRRLHRFTLREDLTTRMPGFTVRLGFGLHVGWAIEGAIGSEYKIDASYLSPNVNMASRLEAATKQFGVSILISEDFACMLSASIDCVTVRGSNRPMGLFTYDVTLERIAAPAPRDHIAATLAAAAAGLAAKTARGPPAGPVKAPSARTPAPGERGAAAAGGEDDPDFQSYSLRPYEQEFLEHPDLVASWAVDEAFLARFAQGFAAYRAGDWATARDILAETRSSRRDDGGRSVVDGPSATLLDFMESHDWAAPAGWSGYRELTEK